jgi:hypothetical protein
LKLSNLVYAAVGYTLGARAGRDRYESIVRAARRFAGSQTVQSTAGVVQAQVDQLAGQARRAMAARLNGESDPRAASANGANGYHR